MTRTVVTILTVDNPTSYIGIFFVYWYSSHFITGDRNW